MMSNDERLAYMADQIVRNFAALGAERASAATADHITAFWDPGMKARAFALMEQKAPFLTPAARTALQLARSGAGEPAGKATRFSAVDEVGRSDAG